QAGLGGATVLGELPPELVALHLALAMTILGLLLLTATATFAQERPLARPTVTPAAGRWATAPAFALFALMIAGAYVAGAGYSLACSGWPLCNGQIVPSDGAAAVQIHFLHRALALLAGVSIAGLLATVWPQRQRAPLVANLALAA